MSYLALARRYRPRQFGDVVGQPSVVRALQHALDGDRLHHAILLTGTRGVGKTTLARIVAKGLNCDTGVTGSPCGQCGSCREIDEGRFVDLLEIDAASNTGVDNVRELIDNSQYPPARGRYKVYLIDEVHMLSKSAFNALLKTLEEPPAHVKFILATTDPQKLPITVLSRCLQLHLKRLSSSLIRDLLGRVLEEEAVAAEPGALAELGRAADGSMRDGLSLLDQALVHAGGEGISTEGVRQMLGTGGRDALYALLGALARGDHEALLAELQRLEALAPDYAALLGDLAAMLQRIALLQALPDARSEDDDDALIELTGLLAAGDVHVDYDIAVHARRDLPWAPSLRAGFEIAILRMLTFARGGHGAAPGGGGGGRPGPRDTAIASGPLGSAASPARVAPVAAARSRPPAAAPRSATASHGDAVESPVQVAAAPADAAVRPAARPAAQADGRGEGFAMPVAAYGPDDRVDVDAAGQPPQVRPDAQAHAEQNDTPATAAPATGSSMREAAAARLAALGEPQPDTHPARCWQRRVATLPLDGLARQLARNCEWQREADGQLHLRLARDLAHLQTPEREAELSAALGVALQIEIVADGEALLTPTRLDRDDEARELAHAELSIGDRPLVRQLSERFGASIREGSVRLLH